MPRMLLFFALLMLTLASSAFAEDADIARLFKEKDVRGMMVISSLDVATGVWFFAMNVNIAKPTDAGLRQKLVMDALKVKGII